MKEILIILALIGLILVVGCSSENQPLNTEPITTPEPQIVPVPVDEGSSLLEQPVTIITPTLIKATPKQTVSLKATTSISSTPVLQRQALIASNPICREMVFCGEIQANSGILPLSSTRCELISSLIITHNPNIISCLMSAYPGTGVNNMKNWNIEHIKLLCKKGIGTPTNCAKYGATLQQL